MGAGVATCRGRGHVERRSDGCDLSQCGAEVAAEVADRSTPEATHTSAASQTHLGHRCRRLHVLGQGCAGRALCLPNLQAQLRGWGSLAGSGRLLARGLHLWLLPQPRHACRLLGLARCRLGEGGGRLAACRRLAQAREPQGAATCWGSSRGHQCVEGGGAADACQAGDSCGLGWPRRLGSSHCGHRWWRLGGGGCGQLGSSAQRAGQCWASSTHDRCCCLGWGSGCSRRTCCRCLRLELLHLCLRLGLLHRCLQGRIQPHRIQSAIQHAGVGSSGVHALELSKPARLTACPPASTHLRLRCRRLGCRHLGQQLADVQLRLPVKRLCGSCSRHSRCGCHSVGGRQGVAAARPLRRAAGRVAGQLGACTACCCLCRLGGAGCGRLLGCGRLVLLLLLRRFHAAAVLGTHAGLGWVHLHLQVAAGSEHSDPGGRWRRGQGACQQAGGMLTSPGSPPALERRAAPTCCTAVGLPGWRGGRCTAAAAGLQDRQSGITGGCRKARRHGLGRRPARTLASGQHPDDSALGRCCLLPLQLVARVHVLLCRWRR